jgi:hypothetical protein
MNERKIVMISSTARDLPNHRERVRLACERAGFDPGKPWLVFFIHKVHPVVIKLCVT